MAGLQPKDILKEKAKAKKDRSEQMKRRENTKKHAQSLAAIIPEPDKKQTFTQFSEHDVRAQTNTSQGHTAETAQPAREQEAAARRAPESEPESELEAQPTPTSSEIAQAETSGKAL